MVETKKQQEIVDKTTRIKLRVLRRRVDEQGNNWKKEATVKSWKRSIAKKDPIVAKDVIRKIETLTWESIAVIKTSKAKVLNSAESPTVVATTVATKTAFAIKNKTPVKISEIKITAQTAWTSAKIIDINAIAIEDEITLNAKTQAKGVRNHYWAEKTERQGDLGVEKCWGKEKNLKGRRNKKISWRKKTITVNLSRSPCQTIWEHL